MRSRAGTAPSVDRGAESGDGGSAPRLVDKAAPSQAPESVTAEPFDTASTAIATGMSVDAVQDGGGDAGTAGVTAAAAAAAEDDEDDEEEDLILEDLATARREVAEKAAGVAAAAAAATTAERSTAGQRYRSVQEVINAFNDGSLPAELVEAGGLQKRQRRPPVRMNM